MAIVTARIHIRGRTPLIWNHFGPDALPLEKKVRQGVAGNDPEEWRKTVLVTEQRQLYIEPSYIFACIRNGAARTRHGRGTLQPIVTATLLVENDRILLNRWLPKENLADFTQAEDQPVYLDVRPVKNPATKARNIRYRVAASPGWEAEFKVSWDNTLLSNGQMESVVRDAGQFAGVGDARNIGRGRFDVVSFELLKEPSAKKPATKRAVANSSR
jgi:hypothetical protein